MTENIIKENGFPKSWVSVRSFYKYRKKICYFQELLEVFYKSEWITNHNLSILQIRLLFIRFIEKPLLKFYLSKWTCSIKPVNFLSWGAEPRCCVNFLACQDCLHKSALGHVVSVLINIQLQPPQWNRSKALPGRDQPIQKPAPQQVGTTQTRGWGGSLGTCLLRPAGLTP